MKACDNLNTTCNEYPVCECGRAWKEAEKKPQPSGDEQELFDAEYGENATRALSIQFEWFQTGYRACLEAHKPQGALPRDTLIEILTGLISRHISTPILPKEAIAAATEIAAAWVQPKPQGAPTLYQVRKTPTYAPGQFIDWTDCTPEEASDYEQTPLLNDWCFEVRRLYTAPPDVAKLNEEIVALKKQASPEMVDHYQALQEQVAQKDEELARLSEENQHLARNLKGKQSVVGATYEHLIKQKEELESKLAELEKDAACTRSHPHENMGAHCETKAKLAEANNLLAHAWAALSACTTDEGPEQNELIYARETFAKISDYIQPAISATTEKGSGENV